MNENVNISPTPIYDETLKETVETESTEEARQWLRDLDSSTASRPQPALSGQVTVNDKGRLAITRK